MKKARLRILPSGREITALQGTPLVDLLHELGVEFPCGGAGSCGKCRVKLTHGELSCSPSHSRTMDRLGLEAPWHLACMCELRGDADIELEQFSTFILADQSTFEFSPSRGYGIAIDVGTSTMVAQLLDLRSARVLAVETALNPQGRFGADLVTRLEKALSGKSAEMTRLLRAAVGRMLHELLRRTGVDRLERILLVGNTVMHHFFCELPLAPLSQYPFHSRHLGACSFSPGDLGWDLEAGAIEFLPSIGSFVGSDILAGIHATGMLGRESYSILVDLGTNGEIVAGNRNGAICASTAAGPAFEGARISMGMQASAGAISGVAIRKGELECRVIGKLRARGICGSGLLDAVAVLHQLGRIGEFGEIRDGSEAISLSDGVVLSAADIQEFLLAKSAISTGIHILLRKLGIGTDQVSQLYLAGGFGTYVNEKHLNTTGMISLDPRRVIKLGNTALMGAKMSLLSGPGLARSALSGIRHMNLEAEADFQDLFISGLKL